MRPKLFADEGRCGRAVALPRRGGLVGAVEAIRDRADSTAVARDFARPAAVRRRRVGPVRVGRRSWREFDVRELPGAGHLANLERPDEFNVHPARLPRACLSSRRSSTWRGSSASSARTISSLGDVRGPNAHARGHIPRLAAARPRLAAADERSATCSTALAPEVGLRLRRHGVTGGERLVLYDRGDGVGAMPAAQMAELAGHPRVAVLLGGLAAWPGELESGQVELHPVKTTYRAAASTPCRRARSSLARLEDPALTLLDVRTARSSPASRATRATRARATSRVRATCTCRTCSSAPGQPLPADLIRARDRRRRTRSSPTAIPARARRWRRSRCARRLQRPQLRGLVARVVAPRRAAAGALGAPLH